jgi:hypothetical protein
LLGELLISTRFKTSAPTAQNGFVRERIVSSRHCRRNNQYQKNICDFNEIAGFEGGSGLLAGGRKQISAAADGADHRWPRRIRLDLPADAHDPQIDGAIERLAVARIGKLQQTLA